MKILHYSLGFPPERTGGLVQYALELAREQSKLGNEVTIMFPGKVSLLTKRVKFKLGQNSGIRTIELINSLPLPLIGNIGRPRDFMKTVDKEIFKKLLLSEKPDVIHIHTLMGLYSEFFSAAKDLKIRIVFTTHDYFGISPNPKFYLQGHDFAQDFEKDIWEYLDGEGVSTFRHRLLQTRFYPRVREFLKLIKVNKHLKSNKKTRLLKKKGNIQLDRDYLDLKRYYANILNKIDIFHFNSYVAKKVYTSYLEFDDFRSCVIHITSDNIKSRNFSNIKSQKIKVIAFIGPYTLEKGFDQFLEFASKNKDSYKFIAMGDNRDISNKYPISNFGKYRKDELDDFVKNVDLVVIPSAWHETFGLVGLEMVSRSIKTVASDKVGFSDYLRDEFKFQDMSTIDVNKIASLKMASFQVNNMEEHAIKIMKLYSGIC